MNKQDFIYKWDKSSDKKRCKMLIEDVGQPDAKKYKINIDNDQVYVTFNDEINNDEFNILNFDDYGYYLLETLFKSLGINAEIV